MLVAQIAVMGAIAWMGFTDPTASGGLAIMAVAAVALGFSSATQDIVIDAYRIEAADESMQALLAAAYQAGYRCGMLVGGAVALYLAAGFGTTAEQYSHDAWKYTYLCMSVAMLVGVATTLVVAEPVRRKVSSYLHGTVDYARFLVLFALIVTSFVVAFLSLGGAVELTTKWLTDSGLPGALPGFVCQAARLGIAIVVALAVARLAVATRVVEREMVQDTYVAPIADFFARYGRPAVVVLLLVGFYRVSDIVLGAVANVFYIDMGYTKETIASAAKVFGLWMTILGGFLGGWLAVKFGVMRVLMLGAVLAAATNLLFVALATSPGQVTMLYVVVAADNLSTGLAGAAFIAYLSGLTSISFTASQYAIFSSLMTLFPKLLSGYSGTIVDAVGYPTFFIGTAIIGIPVLLLVAWVGRNARDRNQGESLKSA